MLPACAGIYALFSFVTASRTQELAIRVPLGASRGYSIRAVIAGDAVPVVAGIVDGLGGAVALSRFTWLERSGHTATRPR